MARTVPFSEAFQNNWAERILSYAEEGMSDVEIRREMRVSKELWYNYLDETRPDFNQEFSETIKEARDKCEAWWEQQGRVNLKDKDFNATLFMMNMVNRFKWRRETKDDSTTLDLAKFIVTMTAERSKAQENSLNAIA